MRRTLDSLVNNEIRTGFAGYTPESVARLLEIFGNPHRGPACAHIAGTNGKGSTAHYLHAMLSAAGYRTGLYTSPHLLVINERIRIGSGMISGGDLERLTAELFEALDADPGLSPTWFDALTLIAFRYFHERDVDFAVIETGLGGRLDSTNVVTPLVSVITSVGLDHTHVLGSTIAEIAREKAGIVKPGVPVVTACRGGALEIIGNAARRHSSPLYIIDKDFSVNVQERGPSGQRFDYVFNGGRSAGARSITLGNLFIPQAPTVQVTNAALAVTAAALMTGDGPVPGDAVREGLSGAVIPGRFERLLDSPTLIFDPAHNPEALAAVLDTAAGTDSRGERAAVVHFMADKDVDAMLGLIQNKLTKRIFYCTLRGSRSWVPDSTRTGNGGMISIAGSEELAAALRSLGDDALVLFTGSFRLYETALEVAEILKGKGNHRGAEAQRKD
jgi:dihydrofolate synthase/folylpolyglutamate synthase